MIAQQGRLVTVLLLWLIVVPAGAALFGWHIMFIVLLLFLLCFVIHYAVGSNKRELC